MRHHGSRSRIPDPCTFCSRVFLAADAFSAPVLSFMHELVRTLLIVSVSFPCGGARYHFLTALRVDTRDAFHRVNVWFKRSVRPLGRGLREQKHHAKPRVKIAT